MFCTAALQPLAGKIYSFFPLKWTFLIFIAIFEIGSLICALAPTSAAFIAGRAVAGIGSSGIINGALSILAIASAPDKRPLLMGIIMSFASAGQLLGPLVGGALTEHVSWRWCFYINLPLGAATIVFLVFLSFPSEVGRRKKFVPNTVVKDFDLVGFAIFVPSIIMLMMALQWGGTKYAWSSATIIGLLIAFALLLVPLCYWEHKAGADAMFPLQMLRKGPVRSACLTGWLMGGIVTVLSYYLPLWFQTVKYASAFQSAIDTLPSFLSQMLFAIICGVICPRFIPFLTVFALIGTALCTIGNGLMTTLQVSTGSGLWIGYQILAGAGRGFVMQTPVQTAQQYISKSEMATGTAVVSFFQFFGGAIMVALSQTAFSNILRTGLEHFAPELDPRIVLESGATDIRNLVPADQVQGLTNAYNDAITKTMYLAMAASLLAFGSALGLGWQKIEQKKVNKVGKPGMDEEAAVQRTSAEAKS